VCRQPPVRMYKGGLTAARKGRSLSFRSCGPSMPWRARAPFFADFGGRRGPATRGNNRLLIRAAGGFFAQHFFLSALARVPLAAE